MNFKRLICFSLFNIVDKGLVFLSPLLVLFLLSDNESYSKIEYVLSVSAILIIFLDLGFKNYIFYGYSQSENVSSYIEKIKSQVVLFFLFYTVVLLVLYFFIPHHPYFFSLLRSLPFCAIIIYGCYFRLIDLPMRTFWVSVPFSLLSILYVFLVYFGNFVFDYEIYFIIQFTYVFLFTIVFLYKNKSVIFLYLKEVPVLIRNGILYSWPVILNVLAISIINQFGKIYLYNYVGSDAMIEMALYQRISIVITLFHSSIVSYFSKDIYVSKSKILHFKIFTVYSSMMFLCFIGLVVSFILNDIYSVININGNAFLFSLLLMSNLLWCFTAYFEVYFNKLALNKLVLFITLISLMVYILLLNIFGFYLEGFVYAMLFSNLFALSLSLALLLKKKGNKI